MAAQRIAPFKAFDDAWFVGVCWVSAWLLPSPQVFITQGHYDHAGGAARLKRELKNARFVVAETGSAEAIESARASKGKPGEWDMIAQDIVAKDGDTFIVGNRTIVVRETPGHTLGTASYLYDVHDGARTYHAVTVGGLGLNAIRDAHQVELYIDSVEKLRNLVTRREAPVEVHLTTHPFATGLMEQRPALTSHVPGTPHPRVDRASLLSQLDALESGAKERLALENAKIQAKSTKP